jgi:hypothetical protein
MNELEITKKKIIIAKKKIVLKIMAFIYIGLQGFNGTY